MTISATTQGARPGVCTSSNRPANPYDGMMIYETDTDKVAVYDSSAWVYKTGTTEPATPTAPGLVLINTTTFTAAASKSIDSCFSATYRNYLITVNNFISTSSAQSDVFVKMRVGGVNTTTGYYNQKLLVANTGVTGSYITTGGLLVGGVGGTGSSRYVDMNFTLHGPSTASMTTVTGVGNYYGSDTVADGWLAGGGRLADTTIYDGFTISASNGNISGTIYIYGYAK